MNHTGCNATDNWWQVQLPDPTSVSRIVVTGRSTFTTRLQDAGVYLGSAPYGGTLDEAERVFTLSGTAAAQEVVLPTPRNAAYLIIKAAADNCLHLSEVAVYGAAPAAPTLTVMDSLYRIALAPIHDNAYLLPHASPVGTLLGAVRGADYQQDRLSYRIESSAPVPFVIDAQGRIVTSAALTPGATHDFRVVVSDGANTAFVSFMAGATELDAVEQSLAGEQLFATDEELLDAALATITASRNLLLDARIRLFNLNPDGSARTDGSSLTALDWNPTHDAALLQSTYGMNIPVLTTNGAGAGYAPKAREIGIAGADPARYLVLGGNPLRNAYRDSSTLNDPMHQWLENSLSWLSGREDLKTTPFQAVIAHLHDNVYFPDERAVRSWLDQHYPGQVSYNAADTCDDVALATCLEAGPDLLILSQYPNAGTDPAAIAAVVTAAMQRGIPVLYLHLDGDMTALGNALLPLFNVSYLGDNYWHRLLLSGFDATSAAAAMPDNIRAIQTLLQHFRAGDYAFDWSACKGEDCSAVPGLDTEFAQGAGAVRSMLGSLDSAGVRLFERTGFRLQKLLVLLGQGYARRVHFPMDKVTTDDNAFMRSLFVDHAAYYQRAGNVPQADLGNFGRSDFSHITPVSKTVNLESKVNFRSVGVYVLPGVPVSVTRLDHSDTAVKVFVNTQRSTATHEWAANGYTRPKYLQSPSMVVNSGETLRFTSPYGGLLQAAFSANDLPVQLQVENVGEHPYWRSSADDAGFAAGLAAGDYDWAELATPGFEVHSTLGRMRESVSNWGDAASLAARTMRYLHNFPHQLAGFQGPGIDAVAEIHDFASTNGLTISTLDMVKHMNADQATCGTGCSGNPYDAYWAFSPVSHGDIHELGHGLEKDRFRFSGWEGHSTTNPYSYYTKTQYFKDTGADPACQTLPFESVFNTLQASVSQTDPQAWLQANLWASSNWSQQVSMTLQMMMA
ncbi:MAG: ImpA family metalloprotease, partial [Thiothrix sp.]|nr:ImpA family metalloprotease [Thiothrix sp.]